LEKSYQKIRIRKIKCLSLCIGIKSYKFKKERMKKRIHVGNGAIVTDVTSTRIYVKEIKKASNIAATDQKALAEAMVKGDIQARNKLIETNLRFAIQVARQYQGMGLELEDLIGFANVGLFEAAERFDVTKGVKFITFAVWYIRAEIQKALNDLSRVVRIPSHKTSTEPQYIKSIHTPVGDDDNKETYADRFLESEATKSGRDKSDLLFDLQRALNQLPEKQRLAITMNYGIGYEYAKPMEQIAEELGVTGERARQLVRLAEKGLQAMPGIKLLEQYL
jgi:RNA polymerase primary sigma factor